MMWLWPKWAVAALAVGGSGLCFYLWWLEREREPRSWSDWLRRCLMVLVVASMGMAPSVKVQRASIVKGANVYFVVDNTGSMAAEDYDGGKPRMDGVRDDIRQIQKAIPGARYSAITFGSEAVRELPLTTDSMAVESFAQTLKTEITFRSQGSSVRRPVELLERELKRARKNHPESLQIVYVFSDGERRGNGSDGADYSKVHGLVDGGGVLGYGTAEGGRMKRNDGVGSVQSLYILDPATGQDAISRIDEGELKKVGQEMGVPYVHRTAPGQSIDVPKVDALERRTEVGRTRRNPVLWPAGILLSILLVWEVVALAPRVRLRVRGR